MPCIFQKLRLFNICFFYGSNIFISEWFNWWLRGPLVWIPRICLWMGLLLGGTPRIQDHQSKLPIYMFIKLILMQMSLESVVGIYWSDIFPTCFLLKYSSCGDMWILHLQMLEWWLLNRKTEWWFQTFLIFHLYVSKWYNLSTISEVETTNPNKNGVSLGFYLVPIQLKQLGMMDDFGSLDQWVGLMGYNL